MKFKTKGSLILISLLFILIIGIGMASASEDINTGIDTDYQSDSIDVSDVSLNDEQIVSEDSLPNYELVNKSKGKLYDDEDPDGGATNDDPFDDPTIEEEDEEYPPDMSMRIEISEPENGTKFVEGEKISIDLAYFEDDEPAYKELYINVYSEKKDPETEDPIVDKYYNCTINETTTFIIPEYLPPYNYLIDFADYEFNEDEGEYGYVILSLTYVGHEEDDYYPGFAIDTNYNKIINANLTVNYNIEELENLVEGDDITAYVSLVDEFNNQMTEKVNLYLFKKGEEGEYKEADVIDGKNVNSIIFENLEEGEYSLEITGINSKIEYTNIVTEPINFTVKSNYDPDNYQIILNPEDEKKLVGDSYEMGVKLLNPSEESEEGSIELYLNGNFVKALELSYDEDGYSHHIVEGLQLGPNNATFLYKVRDGVNVSESVNLIRYETESIIDLIISDIIIGDDAKIKASLSYLDGNVKKPINENFKLYIKKYVEDEDEVEFVYDEEFTIKGSGTITLSDLEEGTYYISAVYKGKNYKYLASEEESTLEVFPKETRVDAVTRTYSTEENVIVGIELADLSGKGIKGTVNIVLDNKTSLQVNTTDDIQHPVELDLGKLGYGLHNIELNYTGDDSEGWLPSYKNAEFLVIYPSFMSIEDGDVTSGSDLTVNISLTGPNDEGINGIITVRIYDNTGKYLINEDFNTTNGVKSIELKNITKDYIIYGRYYGLETSKIEIGPSNHYLSSEAYGFIRIAEGKSEKTEYDLELTKVNDNTVIASLKDSDSKPVANAELTVKVNGVESKAKTDNNGMANISFSGNSSIKVSYTDANNTTAKASMEIIVINNVIEKIVNQTIEVPVEIEKIVYVNQTVEVPVEVEKIVYVIPNRTGTAFEYENMVTTAVASADGRIGEYFNVRLIDANGKPLAYKPIKIGFNGVVYDRTTDADGRAKLQINLGYKGDYTFAIGFLGDDNYTGAFEVAKITVKLQKPQLSTASKTYKASAKTKTLTATFKSQYGNAVSGKKISFTVNGKTYSGTTNSKGIASVNVSLSKKGTYSFTVKWAGNNQFAAVTKSGKLTIK